MNETQWWNVVKFKNFIIEKIIIKDKHINVFTKFLSRLIVLDYFLKAKKKRDDVDSYFMI